MEICLTTSHQKKLEDTLMCQITPLENGIEKEKLKLSELENIGGIKLIQEQEVPLEEQKNKESATVESLLLHKKKILNDKYNFLNPIILSTQLSLILDQESTLKEKDLKPFWTAQSKEISNRLWLPTRIDCVDSVLSCMKESSENTPMGKSWFSIKKKHPQNKSSLMTSFQLSQFSLPDCMGLEVTQSKTKLEPKLKTLKVRLLPSDQEKEQLQLIMNQYRWYYNKLLDCFQDKYYNQELILKKDSYEYEEIRDLLSTYDFVEKNIGDEYRLQMVQPRESGEIRKQKDERSLMYEEDKLSNDLRNKENNEILKIKKDEEIRKFKEYLKTVTKEERKKIKKQMEEKQRKLRHEKKEADKQFKLQCREENKRKRNEEKERMTPLEKERERELRKQTSDENKQFVPHWWAENKPHTRIGRGAAKKISQNVNSCITNFKNKNINKFEMKHMSRKKDTEYALFEDEKYPSFIKSIKGRYWYTNRENKKCAFSMSSLLSQTKDRGCEIIYEKSTDRYFLHYPVEYDFFPDDDRRNDNQVRFTYKAERVISLDPGVRKFLVGYDPTGTTVFVGQGSNKLLTELLLDVDKNPSIEKWRKIKNMINELHWKTVSFLIENYDVIILPDFRVSEMVKSKKLTRMTKRLMCMYSFYSFRQKLEWKCSLYNKKIFIVDESYTSKTCGSCGVLNDVKGNETYTCSSCGLVCDRDVSGARNIFIKNTGLRCP